MIRTKYHNQMGIYLIQCIVNFSRMLAFAFICAHFFVLVLNVSCTPPPNPTGNVNVQDDANKIFTAPDRNKALLDIFPARNFKQCKQINEEFAKLNGGVPLVGDINQHVARDSTTIFQDLLFAKIYGPEMTKLVFLKSVLEQSYVGARTVLVEIMIIEDKNRPTLIDTYNHTGKKPFIDGLNEYQDDFNHFLLELYNRVREEGNDEPKPEQVDEAVNLLNEERKKKHSWGNHRKELDTQLMNKPIKFAVEVIKKYAESNHGNLLRDDVEKKVNCSLVFGYQSLIDLILNPYEFMAALIYDSVDRDVTDKKTTAIYLIVCNSENGELTKINDAFKNAYGKPINEFLLQNEPEDIVRQMLAAIVVNTIQSQPTSSPSPSSSSP